MTTALSGPPKDSVDLSFDPIHEAWSIYKTKDAVLIKMRLIPLKFLLMGMKEDGTAQLAMGGNLVFAVMAPKELKGSPTTQSMTHEQITAAIVEPNVPFDTVKEDWNEYDVEGLKVGAKLIATVISKTSLFDDTGQPIYNVNWQNVLRAITKPEDKAKLQKIWAERSPQTAGSQTPKAP